jgi:YHS domain-containing protein
MKTAILVILSFVSFCLHAQQDNATRKRNHNLENEIALRHFDPVSYFQNKPMKGTDKIRFDFKGVTYYFSSEENRETFKKSPEKFEPMYGGWCAYTLATKGERVRIDPTAYKIIDGKLYLFYNFSGENRMKKWTDSKDQKALKLNAAKGWAKTMH